MVKVLAKVSLLAVSLMLAQPGHAAPVRDQHWSLLAQRLFPTLMKLEQTQPAAGRRPRELTKLFEARKTRISACQHVAKCVLTASLWTDSEITTLIKTIPDRASPGPTNAGLTNAGLTNAGLAKATTAATASSPDDTAAAQAGRELRGLNDILKVYGLGAVPLNPQIDGPIDPAGSAQFTVAVSNALNLADIGADDPVTELDPSIATALSLLDANNRADAIAYEPLDGGTNAAALKRAGTTDWKRYRYTAIIVPGNGPDELTTPLSARGKERVRLAASRFTDGLAPFIIVSGGAVHPRGTKTAEAIEMRKALIERYGIPADSIVVEPYARYTITNLRNATRRLIAMQAPIDREALVVTDADQSQSIESPDFKAKNLERLGYQPGTIGARLSPYDLTFRPSTESLRLNPADPLDP